MMALVRVPALTPSEASKRSVDRAVALTLPPLGLLLRWWQRLTIDGREHIPRHGPALLLSNHLTWFDPFTAMVVAGRPVHFLAGEGMFHHPVLGRLGRWSGAVPRKKFVHDARSVRTLHRWASVGGLVGLFPEAERSWDGRPLPLFPGIGRLIQVFPCPVVTMRIVNGHRQNPRWGAHQRHGRVHVEVDPPAEFGRGDDPHEIEAWLRERLTVDPARGLDWPVWGRRLAEGLDNVLYRCPACAALDALVCRGDDAVCRACGAGWRIDVRHELHPHGGGPALPLVPLLAGLQDAAAALDPPDAARFAADGTVLESEPATLLDISGDVSDDLGGGRLRLTADALSFTDGDDVRWSSPLAEVDSIYVYMRRRLQIRAGDRLLEVVAPTESVVKWQWIGEAWHRAATERRGAG